MKLWFVMANVDGESLDWFVRAPNPREAFKAWREIGMVSDFYIGVGDQVIIIEAPSVAGPIGAVDWPLENRFIGKREKDFPNASTHA